METTDLSKMDIYKGHKVNHPYSGANILFALLTFVFAAFPVLFLFIPSIANDPGVNGIDVIKYGIDIMKNSANGGVMPPNTNLTFQVIIELIKINMPEYTDASIVMIVVLTFLIFIMCFFSVVLILVSIVHLAKGHLKYSVAVPIIAAIDFTLSIAYFVILIIYYTWLAQISGTQPLVIWFVTIPIGIALFFLLIFGIIQGSKFSGSILESEIVIEEPVEEKKPEPVKEKVAEQNVIIPLDTTNIGGHAYAENKQIQVANIPLAVTKLGPGAFANCVNLKVVSIPKSVVEIGENCFFNCASLERINYAGTKLEWSKIKRGSNWLARAKTTNVVCSDSTIVVDPYK